MSAISQKQAKHYGVMVVVAAWLAVFCLFGYRSSFSIMQKMMVESTGWTSVQTSLGYCLMMTIYAVTAFFSGRIIDKGGTRITYYIGAACCFLGFFLTSFVTNVASGPAVYYAYLATYGLFAGVGTGMLWLSATISVRKWYVGQRYGTMWGFAFMGAPMAQLLLTLVLKGILVSWGWEMGMRVLAVIMAVFLIIAAIVAKKTPEDYGVEAFGAETLPKAVTSRKAWGLGEAFKTWPIWATIFAFLCSMMGEFLVWSQVVSYFQDDMNLTLDTASNIYLIIGIAGIFAMPLTGRASDILVKKFANERKARKLMLIIGPACGVIGVILLLTKSVPLCIAAMLFFAVYWGIEPGGCAGYAGSVYGGAGLGRIWGLATLFIMGTGPSIGTFMGAFFRDTLGDYTYSLIFALGAFALSLFFALLMPLRLKGEETSSAPSTRASDTSHGRVPAPVRQSVQQETTTQ